MTKSWLLMMTDSPQECSVLPKLMMVHTPDKVVGKLLPVSDLALPNID
jgi:hypothetical protein